MQCPLSIQCLCFCTAWSETEALILTRQLPGLTLTGFRTCSLALLFPISASEYCKTALFAVPATLVVVIVYNNWRAGLFFCRGNIFREIKQNLVLLIQIARESMGLQRCLQSQGWTRNLFYHLLKAQRFYRTCSKPKTWCACFHSKTGKFKQKKNQTRNLCVSLIIWHLKEFFYFLLFFYFSLVASAKHHTSFRCTLYQLIINS